MQDNKKHLYTIIYVVEHLIILQTNKDKKENTICGDIDWSLNLSSIKQWKVIITRSELNVYVHNPFLLSYWWEVLTVIHLTSDGHMIFISKFETRVSVTITHGLTHPSGLNGPHLCFLSYLPNTL